ncbi:putative bacteriophage protein [Klebsiella pneumoniae]|nr:putative bacteriophage protein [Klebsiella pneumoniae]STS26597.1 putative bacteriophage protein [Klebsiella pneumoniae]STS27938.1 putative bacteriophage protein [Klebsiella pneumoniae]
MAKPDWGALQHQFLAEHAKTGISPKDWCAAQGLNYSSAKRYIKVTTYGANSQKKSANKSANSQKEKGGANKNGRVEKNQPDTGARSKSPETKPIRGSRTAPPTNAFQPGNQNALKHGGYGRRMLLSDAITEDAQMLTLDDELFWLRAASLTAAENIGRWQTELEIADSEQAKDLHDLISQAQKAMHRNTARIESLEYTKAAIIKQRVDAAYREAATEKVELEIDVLKDGDKDNAIVVHNSLPIPGR